MWALRFLAVLSGLLLVASAVNIGRFWHVTDFHYDRSYFNSQLSCNDDVPSPGPYGDYWCDSPWSLIHSAANFLAQVTRDTPDVDFAIWTGDTQAHISDNDTTLEENLSVLQAVTSALEKALPGIPVYASLGNHDFYPTDQAEGNTSEIYRKVGDMWRSWISSTAQVQRFEDGGFYSTTLPKAANVRLLALNTNLYYTSNDVTPKDDDPAGQFVWMESQLQKAKAAGQKVILTGHVPPGLLTPGLVNWYYPNHKQRFMEIVLEYSDVIAATHFGHDHSDGFKILQDSKGSKSLSQYTAPSVTPWRHKITAPTGVESGAPHNPGVRLIEYDRDTGAHLDYHQYFINLTEANAQNETKWRKLYSFCEAYDVPDMSVTSLRKIFVRVKNGAGRKYTSQFCKFALVSEEEKPCTDETRGQIYCGGLNYDKTQAEACVGDYLNRVNNRAESLALNLTPSLFFVAVMMLLRY